MKKVNFNDLSIQYQNNKHNIDNAIKNVLEKQNFIQGDEVKAIESMLSEYTSTKALSVANGTDALFIALKALGVKAGDEVITPAFTWVSTVEVIKLLNAKPAFIDISEDTFNLNESLINELINEKNKGYPSCFPFWTLSSFR